MSGDCKHNVITISMISVFLNKVNLCSIMKIVLCLSLETVSLAYALLDSRSHPDAYKFGGLVTPAPIQGKHLFTFIIIHSMDALYN